MCLIPLQAIYTGDPHSTLNSMMQAASTQKCISYCLILTNCLIVMLTTVYFAL